MSPLAAASLAGAGVLAVAALVWGVLSLVSILGEDSVTAAPDSPMGDAPAATAIPEPESTPDTTAVPEDWIVGDLCVENPGTVTTRDGAWQVTLGSGIEDCTEDWLVWSTGDGYEDTDTLLYAEAFGTSEGTHDASLRVEYFPEWETGSLEESNTAWAEFELSIYPDESRQVPCPEFTASAAVEVNCVSVLAEPEHGATQTSRVLVDMGSDILVFNVRDYEPDAAPDHLAMLLDAVSTVTPAE